MPSIPLRLAADTLTLRPWSAEDSVGLAELFQDEAMRRWTDAAVHDEASATCWVTAQQRGWETGVPGSTPRLVGHVVLKYAARGSGSAEVGYWTAAHARGRGVAHRALTALTDWAFEAFAREGLTRLELVHQADNVASCRVAEKAGFAPTGVLPAAPPAFPLDGHVHERHAPAAV